MSSISAFRIQLVKYKFTMHAEIEILKDCITSFR